MTIEQQVIEQLSQYRQKKARIQALSTYSVGAGITVSRLNEDDQLQELHRRLRGLPSYMYLSGYEQKLENVAHAYMTRYPVGVKAQKESIPAQVMDPEDTELLQELRRKIQKVIEARGYDIRNGIEEIMERLTELQDLQAEVNRIDTVLDALEQYKPDYAKLLRLHLIDGVPWDKATKELSISKDVFYRWRKKALTEYEKLAN
ncbi:RNA polymerase subunit sigma-24 [Paenibacillus lautus]|uniref:RNA polymerase subunit sigma-24 n=1 Tax=Paenibacillus lautus TaxID=1401 RepID=UPI001C7CC21E|nr:RNA polymerase subunit sigma-24 [Paenibacillus lautus]MBX4145952.1 RNA polymerase subunit sigma-24 [Paenibacillus lautus]